MTILEAEEKYSVYISIIPELYKNGVNWNWQIQWYAFGSKIEGTYMFGDNHEHPTRENAEEAAIDYLILLKEKSDEEAIKNYRKNYS